MTNTMVVTFAHPDMVSNFPYVASRESIKNLKTKDKALRTLNRRNLKNISHATYKGEVIYSRN